MHTHVLVVCWRVSAARGSRAAFGAVCVIGENQRFLQRLRRLEILKHTFNAIKASTPTANIQRRRCVIVAKI
jgi:HAMP domain-containing protein